MKLMRGAMLRTFGAPTDPANLQNPELRAIEAAYVIGLHQERSDFIEPASGENIDPLRFRSHPVAASYRIAVLVMH